MTSFTLVLAALAVLSIQVNALSANSNLAPPTHVVDLRSHVSLETQTAVQFCQGIMNRNVTGDSVYVLTEQRDLDWLSWSLGVNNPKTVDPEMFLKTVCYVPSNAAIKGLLLYSYPMQQAIFPTLLTVAGVLDLIPVTSAVPGVPVVFDAVKQFGTQDPKDVVTYVHSNFVNSTTGMSMMDPGYDQAKGPINPPLTGSPNIGLADYIASRRLFNTYLYNGCISLSPEYKVMNTLVTENPWQKPVAVFGYNEAWRLFGGDTFEAETDCAKAHNMGQVASDGCSNLSFWSRSPSVTTPISQTPTPSCCGNDEKKKVKKTRKQKRAAKNTAQSADGKYHYDANRTYVSIFVGDGDNVNYIKGSRADWINARVSRCLAQRKSKGGNDCTGDCFPLVWTLSPHLVNVAPDWLNWYLQKVKSTGCDWYVLPPAGGLYAYGAMMPSTNATLEGFPQYSPDWSDELRVAEINALGAAGDVQAAYVRLTERFSWLYNTSVSMEWEWFYSWDKALKNYLPRYAERHVVKGFVPTNVPYMFPVLQFIDKEYYIFGNGAQDDKVVVFAPVEWRGVKNTTDPITKPFYYSAQQMADSLNSRPRGSTVAIYVTSDGGADIDLIMSLPKLLDDHVMMVDHEALVAMGQLGAEHSSSTVQKD